MKRSLLRRTTFYSSAAAGSGKSPTLVAKILYLLKEGRYTANQIIAFAYNKDAQLELTARIDGLFERFKWMGERVPARTFHGFCMEVLATVHDEKPSIAGVATAGKSQQLNFFVQLVEELRQSNPGFAADLLNYYSIFKFPAPRESEIQSLNDYNEYLKSLEGRGGRDPVTGEWRVSLTSMSGIEVKSLEELVLPTGYSSMAYTLNTNVAMSTTLRTRNTVSTIQISTIPISTYGMSTLQSTTTGAHPSSCEGMKMASVGSAHCIRRKKLNCLKPTPLISMTDLYLIA